VTHCPDSLLRPILCRYSFIVMEPYASVHCLYAASRFLFAAR